MDTSKHIIIGVDESNRIVRPISLSYSEHELDGRGAWVILAFDEEANEYRALVLADSVFDHLTDDDEADLNRILKEREASVPTAIETPQYEAQQNAVPVEDLTPVAETE